MALNHRCLIHIGAPKTGTTLLQRVLFENRDVLARHDMLYPDVSLRGYGHHDLAFLLGGGYPAWATPQDRSLDDLTKDLERLARNHQGSLLFSSEDFYLCANPEALYDLLSRTGAFKGRDCSVIVYVRRQDEAHESWYNQTIKAQGYTHDLDECVRAFHELWDYRKQLARWSSVFGKDALVVRPYEESEYVGGSLLADFLSILRLPINEFVVTKERVNTKLNADLLEFQRILNKLPLSVQQKRRFHHQLIDLSTRTEQSGLFDESPLIDAARRRTILADYAEGNAEVATSYLGRNQLFSDTISSTPLAKTERGLTVEKLGSVLAWLLVKEA